MTTNEAMARAELAKDRLAHYGDRPPRMKPLDLAKCEVTMTLAECKQTDEMIGILYDRLKMCHEMLSDALEVMPPSGSRECIEHYLAGLDPVDIADLKERR